MNRRQLILAGAGAGISAGIGTVAEAQQPALTSRIVKPPGMEQARGAARDAAIAEHRAQITREMNLLPPADPRRVQMQQMLDRTH